METLTETGITAGAVYSILVLQHCGDAPKLCIRLKKELPGVRATPCASISEARGKLKTQPVDLVIAGLSAGAELMPFFEEVRKSGDGIFRLLAAGAGCLQTASAFLAHVDGFLNQHDGLGMEGIVARVRQIREAKGNPDEANRDFEFHRRVFACAQIRDRQLRDMLPTDRIVLTRAALGWCNQRIARVDKIPEYECRRARQRLRARFEIQSVDELGRKAEPMGLVFKREDLAYAVDLDPVLQKRNVASQKKSSRLRALHKKLTAKKQ
ncbi:MAG: hypothetical protein LBK99_13300 [Opitutaceae bacterium]|jgi:hypothetical protein|nr:hypothetical protein [Opitutaceae bacterium]